MDDIKPDRSTADSGDANAEITRLRRLLTRSQTDDNDDGALRRSAELSGKLGDLLVEANRLPEAILAYQEATDAFGKLPDSGELAEHFARRVVSGVNELWKRPAERLDLLLAKLEREQRQILVVGNSPMQAAEIAFKMATILHRRDRLEEAERKYLQSIALFQIAEGIEVRLAEVQMRTAGLYHYELENPQSAIPHYRAAMALFTEYEPPYEGEQMNRKLCEELLAQAVSAALNQFADS